MCQISELIKWIIRQTIVGVPIVADHEVVCMVLDKKWGCESQITPKPKQTTVLL